LGERGYRLKELGNEDLTDAQRAVVDELKAGPRGGVVGPYDAWLRRPDFARRARLLGDYCRFEAEMPRDVAELAIIVAGRYWDAPFEFWAHAPLAVDAGVPQEAVDAIRAGERPNLEDPRLSAAYSLLSEYFASHEVTEATYHRAIEVLGEEMVVDIVAVAGYYGVVCMTLNVFQMPLPAGAAHPFAS
jgi:4-carboxymuconolactone decarboxylase